MGAAQLSLFGANIFLPIGLLIVAVVACAVLIAVWTGVKLWWWKRGERRTQPEFRLARFAPDGTRLPRATRGICEVCGEPSDQVLHLPSGERLCPRHYAERSRAGATQSPADTGGA